MLVSERKTEAETWLSEVDGLAFGMKRPERLGVLHAAYRAAAISVMNERKIVRGDTYKDKWHVEGGRRVRRVGERFESAPIDIPSYRPCRVSVGVARNAYQSARLLLAGRSSDIRREEFYIRDLSVFTRGIEPDIKYEDWGVEPGDFRLVPRQAVERDIFRDDTARFGREIAHLAVSLDVELPSTLEEFSATRLK